MGERDIGPWPEAIPHPYNIVTNDFTQDYGVYGPVSEDEYRLEDEFLSQCGHAMMTMHQSVEAYKMAVSDEERKLHKVALEHARSIWLHYNAKLSLRFRRSPSELAQFDLSERPVPEQDDF